MAWCSFIFDLLNRLGRRYTIEPKRKHKHHLSPTQRKRSKRRQQSASRRANR